MPQLTELDELIELEAKWQSWKSSISRPSSFPDGDRLLELRKKYLDLLK